MAGEAAKAAPARGEQNVAGAALWMGGALVCFMLMAVAGRELRTEVSTFEVLFFRSFFALFVLVPLMWHMGWKPLRTERLGLHALRSSVHYVGQWGWFFAIGLIPMAEVFAIEFTSPIWTAIFAFIFLRERVSPLRMFAILLGFIGVIVILRPGVEAIQYASLGALVGAIGYAGTYVVTRAMAPTEGALTIVFYMNLIQLPMGLIPSIPVWVWPSDHLWFWAVVIGLVGIGSHFCLSRAFALADASVVAPMDFVRLPLIAILGYLVYQEQLDPMVALGAVIICTGNWLNIRARARG